MRFVQMELMVIIAHSFVNAEMAQNAGRMTACAFVNWVTWAIAVKNVSNMMAIIIKAKLILILFNFYSLHTWILWI